MPRTRPQKVAELIQHTLAQLLRQKAKDPRFAMVTITSVDISPDLANATVYFTVLDETKVKETLVALNNAAGYMRHFLAENVELRIIPKLKFSYDESIHRADRLSKLIDEALGHSSKDSDE